MASSNFSNDVMFEILSRTDLKTMKKCRILSKECKDLTYESSFMQLHLQRTTTMVGYLLQSLQSCLFDSLFLSIDNLDSDRKVTRNFLDFLSKREPVRILAMVNEAHSSRKSSRVLILDILRRRWACWCLDRSLYGSKSFGSPTACTTPGRDVPRKVTRTVSMTDVTDDTIVRFSIRRVGNGVNRTI
ncbi:hypothetical protein V6N13_014030 [Hibiscus sabdariffa]|uniref:F-box domain-containing protein n=1 Tax=Hibiscus sabdariffa TaxID=183260 RepID=A0ABR2RU15_9ROSI